MAFMLSCVNASHSINPLTLGSMHIQCLCISRILLDLFCCMVLYVTIRIQPIVTDGNQMNMPLHTHVFYMNQTIICAQHGHYLNKSSQKYID